MRIRAMTAAIMTAALAGCANEPIRYIPPGDRAVLESEARLGQDGAGGGTPLSVADMLARARGASQTQAANAAAAAAAPSRVVLRFTGDAVQPDSGQRAELAAFAAAHKPTDQAVVTARADSVDRGAFLGQRRAVAVSKALAGTWPDIAIRFDPNMPDGLVTVAVGANQSGTP